MREQIFTPELAIIDRNTLSCIGLQNILEELIPNSIIRIFHSFGEFSDDTPDMYSHYFVSSQIYFEHPQFFIERKPKAIVLITGETSHQLSGVPTLNICHSEKKLIKSIINLQKYGHDNDKSHSHRNNFVQRNELSSREIEVLVLIAKGFINKEIAEKLNIGITTVISHRKNITEKLGMKSVSALTIYAVMNGYIEADRI